MENTINCLTLFYKVGSLIRDFSRKEKFRILVKAISPSSYSEKKFGKLSFYSFFNINNESKNNYLTDAFEISQKIISPSGVIFQCF